jgi:hypothetical protein
VLDILRKEGEAKLEDVMIIVLAESSASNPAGRNLA